IGNTALELAGDIQAIGEFIEGAVMTEIYFDGTLIRRNGPVVVLHTLSRQSDIIIDLILVISERERLFVVVNRVVKVPLQRMNGSFGQKDIGVVRLKRMCLIKQFKRLVKLLQV